MVGRGGNLTWRDLVLHGKQVFAHGYVESPVSRGYQGSLDRNTLGWSAAFEKYGNVISNPQSLETKKAFQKQDQ